MSNFEIPGLYPELVQTVSEMGYEEPTPIQAESIPLLLEGRDVLGQAQTGTGKTAAFTLPMLQTLDDAVPDVQAIVLTPTRELAIQVAHAVFHYGTALDVRVLPIYGGQSYNRQIKRLKQDTQVVVGTPGRTLDLIRKGVLKLDKIRYLVLDEADEMLKMGFIEDITAILGATPDERQTAMFSATLSRDVVKLASQYTRNPVEVIIKDKTRTVATTEQRYHMVAARDKLAALSLVLESEFIQSVLVFTRTKVGAAELAEQLIQRNYPAEALHGDLDQNVRETVLRRFRNGDLQILIGTDVMARGVDIPDVSHVINYDLPPKGEEYVHRIGRTGRAGRRGMAVSLVTPVERHTLENIQRYTRQPITRLPLPTPEAVYYQRDVRFINRMETILQNAEIGDELTLVDELVAAGCHPAEVAAAAIQIARAEESLRPIQAVREVQESQKRESRSKSSRRRGEDRNGTKRGSDRDKSRRSDKQYDNSNMVKLCMEVGKIHGVQPRDVVGAVANESGISGRAIGEIEIKKYQTFFDVKEDVVGQVLGKMQRSYLRGEAMNIKRA